MTDAASQTLVTRLVSEVAALRPIYDAHMQFMDGELLPHVLFADVRSFVESAFDQRSGHVRREAVRVLEILEDGFAAADASVVNLISVSFLENLDPHSQGYDELRQAMGPHLREELKTYEGG
jgi:hypothetical protein